MNTACDNTVDTALLASVIDVAKEAGEAIMAVYATDFEQYQKDDASPLTEADLAAHQIICQRLEAISDWPVLSEESSAEQMDWMVRQQWSRYWLVDPLDGTKEFISRSGEFTVNIALIDQGKAIMGVVYCPPLDCMYYAAEGVGSFKLIASGEPQQLAVANAPDSSEGEENTCWRIVGSRRHGAEALAEFADRLGEVELVSMGSSLKLCLVAEGTAHLYPRLALTCEWDTAAAQAVVEQAGGQVLTPELASIRYGEKEDLLNPFFMVCGETDERWTEVFARAATVL